MRGKSNKGLKLHDNCRNLEYIKPGYKLPIVAIDDQFGEYVVVDKPYDLLINSGTNEWNMLGLLDRDFHYLLTWNLQQSSGSSANTQKEQKETE